MLRLQNFMVFLSHFHMFISFYSFLPFYYQQHFMHHLQNHFLKIHQNHFQSNLDQHLFFLSCLCAKSGIFLQLNIYFWAKFTFQTKMKNACFPTTRQVTFVSNDSAGLRIIKACVHCFLSNFYFFTK